MSELSIVAMGGNSLLDPTLPPTVENQFAATSRAAGPIADLLARGERLLLTHGNGPQVGFMQLRSELCRHLLHEVPLDSLDADTQGAIGYMIQRTLRNELVRRRAQAEIATLVTEVEVDANDPAFSNPTKPVGRFYKAEEADVFRRERGWHMVEDAGRGYRRVVPSPKPLRIVQLETIRKLTELGVTVIACGAGGIPVTTDGEGQSRGLEAVVDKDRATSLLATALGAQRLLITTTTASELRELMAQGQFPAGSMGPKIEAAIDFLDHGGGEVVICRPEALLEAHRGHAGTTIRR